jgi:hypothetical protein
VAVVKEFHQQAKLPKDISSYFLALIPKVKKPQQVKDFRPISLLGCLYKILAKLIILRLRVVLPPLISDCQSAFLQGRYILDSVAVLSETIDMAKQSGKSCFILKVDFERAYDSVSWSLLTYMLSRCGFSDTFKSWIKACVFIGDLSVLVNGSPSKEVKINRGLKQGSPLAPFLFLLIAEGLAGLMRQAVAVGKYNGFKIGNSGKEISMLQYADDTILIGEPSWNNLWTLKAVLRSFELISGLKVNFSKSNVYGVNVDPYFLHSASVFLHCKQGNFPLNYLGIPVGVSARKKSTSKTVIDKIKNRLASWKGRDISLGGRVTLINSVSNNFSIYFLSFYKAPSSVNHKYSKAFFYGVDVWKIRRFLGLDGKRYVNLRVRVG